jgi:hypothetical protein
MRVSEQKKETVSKAPGRRWIRRMYADFLYDSIFYKKNLSGNQMMFFKYFPDRLKRIIQLFLRVSSH